MKGQKQKQHEHRDTIIYCSGEMPWNERQWKSPTAWGRNVDRIQERETQT